MSESRLDLLAIGAPVNAAFLLGFITKFSTDEAVAQSATPMSSTSCVWSVTVKPPFKLTLRVGSLLSQVKKRREAAAALFSSVLKDHALGDEPVGPMVDVS